MPRGHSFLFTNKNGILKAFAATANVRNVLVTLEKQLRDTCLGEEKRHAAVDSHERRSTIGKDCFTTSTTPIALGKVR